MSLGIFTRQQNACLSRRRYLPFLRTLEDLDLVALIGLRQSQGAPITMKEIAAQDLGSVATQQRRVARLRMLGIVVPGPQAEDRRSVTLVLSERALRAFYNYDAMLGLGDRR